MSVFGVVRKLRSVYSFNDTATLEYDEPNQEGDKQAVIAWDASGSMHHYQQECKMVASALKCMTGTKDAFNIPDPSGQTALLDTINMVAALKLEGVSDIIVVTDGEDTCSTTTQVITGFEADGETPIMGAFPSGREARYEAIAEHCKHMGVRPFFIGIGNEVKHFIDTLSKRSNGRIVTAHIPAKLTTADVGAVVATTLAREPRHTVNAANAAPLTEEQVQEISATVVVANAPRLSSDKVQDIEEQVARTHTQAERARNPALLKDGPSYDPAAQADYVSYILRKEAEHLYESIEEKGDADEAEVRTVLVNGLRSALGWFCAQLDKRGVEVAGALIGGQTFPPPKPGLNHKGAVFGAPVKGLKNSRFVSSIKKLLELFSRNPEAINANTRTPGKERVPGLDEAFADAIANNTVGPLFRETGSPASHLRLDASDLPVQLTGRAIFYKFVETKGPHYVRWHRGKEYAFVIKPDDNLASLPVAHLGNSSEKGYGGPAITIAPASPVAAAASEAEDEEEEYERYAEAEGDTASVADSSSAADPEETNMLKRKLELVEAANKVYKTENKKLKLQLDFIKKAVNA